MVVKIGRSLGEWNLWILQRWKVSQQRKRLGYIHSIINHYPWLFRQVINNFRNVPHVTILLAWTHRKDDVSLKINIISTLTSWNSHQATVVPNHGLTYREKNLHDVEIRLEDLPHKERSPTAEQLLELIWLAWWGAFPIHCISTSLSISNDGKHSPFIMFSSLPSICNDGKHSPSFLSSFPFEESTMMESTSYLKNLHVPPRPI